MRQEYDFTKATKLTEMLGKFGRVSSLESNDPHLLEILNTKLSECTKPQIPGDIAAKVATVVKDNSGYNRETELTIQQARNGINMSGPFTDVASLMEDLNDPHAYGILSIEYQTSATDPISSIIDKDLASEWGFYLLRENRLINKTVIRYPEDDLDKLIDKIEAILNGFKDSIKLPAAQGFVSGYITLLIQDFREQNGHFESPNLEASLGDLSVVSGDKTPFPGYFWMSLTWGHLVTEVNL